jgi:hypothetical protein
MIQHKLEGICNVDITRSLDFKMSLELPDAMSIEFLGQQVFNIPMLMSVLI